MSKLSLKRRLDKLKVFGKDKDDNNILHHTYMNEMPHVRLMLLGTYISPKQM